MLEDVGFDWENPRKRKKQQDPYTRPVGSNTYFEERWNEMFKKLKLYKKRHGNTLVPTKYPKDKQLGNWVCAQRTVSRFKYSNGWIRRMRRYALIQCQLVEKLGWQLTL